MRSVVVVVVKNNIINYILITDSIFIIIFLKWSSTVIK